ncbi:MAG: DUF86 domain-containing protein [Syntrophorhabdaceae bacterium]|nr:DUF86 domain-containing protein [Syntrophorhabdaceae bacterium]
MEDKNYFIIEKIVGHIDKIASYIAGLEQTMFLADTKAVEACVFNLLQMGELVGRLDEGFRKAHADIPWFKIRGLRNKIAHDYEGVSLEIIWDIVKDDLSVLRGQLADLWRKDKNSTG